MRQSVKGMTINKHHKLQFKINRTREVNAQMTNIQVQNWKEEKNA